MPAEAGGTAGIRGDAAAPTLPGDSPVPLSEGPDSRGLECPPSQGGFSSLELAAGRVRGCRAKLGGVGRAEPSRSPGEGAGPGKQQSLDVAVAEALQARPAIPRRCLLLPRGCGVG